MKKHPKHTLTYEPRWVRKDGEPNVPIRKAGSLSNRPKERPDRNYWKAWVSSTPHMEWWEVGRK